MINYYVENGIIIINKYVVKYKNLTTSNKVITNSDIIQYVYDDMELNGLISELERKSLDYECHKLDTDNILKYNGLAVSDYEEARKLLEPTINELIDKKISEIKQECKNHIYNGIDVDLENGEKKHFSLTLEDQININGLASQISIGNLNNETKVPYHADGEMCTLFSISDFNLIANKAAEYIISQTTYCNHIMAYIKSLETAEDLNNVYYGMPLTGEFLNNFETITK